MINSKLDSNLKSHFSLCFRAAPMLYCIHAEALLAKGHFVQLLALSDGYLEAARVYPNVYAEVVLQIEIAGAYKALGQDDKAKEHIKSALKLAKPDGIIMPFAEYGRYIHEILVSYNEEEFAEEIERILQISSIYLQSVKKIIAENFSEDSYGLTTRELEVAKLAAKRLSNKEIAEHLVISESTVKTQLARVFSKLDIKKRRDLENYFP